MSQVRRPRALRLGLGVGCTAAALAVAGCGSSSGSSPNSSTAAGAGQGQSTASSGGGDPAAGYSGAEASLPRTWPAPKKKSGYSFTVGWLIPNGSIPSLQELTTGIKQEVAALGGRLIVLDSQLNPQTEVSNFNQLLAQHVSGIVSFPLDPKSLAPSLAQAKAAHIPVVAIDAPPAANGSLIPGYLGDVLLSRDLGAYSVAKQAASVTPGGTFALLGIAAPIPSLTYVIAQEKHYAEADGLKFVGEVDSQQDSSSGAATAMSAILGKSPKVNFVFTYNDVSGVGAASQALTGNDTSVKVVGFNGEDEALQSVKAGRLFGTYDIPYVQDGVEAVTGLYDSLTKQHLPLAAKISDPGHTVTR